MTNTYSFTDFLNIVQVGLDFALVFKCGNDVLVFPADFMGNAAQLAVLEGVIIKMTCVDKKRICQPIQHSQLFLVSISIRVEQLAQPYV